MVVTSNEVTVTVSQPVALYSVLAPGSHATLSSTTDLATAEEEARSAGSGALVVASINGSLQVVYTVP
jgi:hypothetical protein